MQEKFNDTKITISGLSPLTAYKFLVFSENGVTNVSNNVAEFIDITVTTEASTSTASVNNVRVTSTKATEIALAWDPPYLPDVEGDPSNFIETYEVGIIMINIW